MTIKDKVRILNRTCIQDTPTPIFDSSVPEKNIRYILGIFVSGIATPQKITIERVNEDGTFVMLFHEVYVAPDNILATANTHNTGSDVNVSIPNNWQFNINNPFLVCEGGTNLSATASFPAVTPARLTIIYYDDLV